MPVFSSSGYIPRNGIARSRGNSVFNVLRNHCFPHRAYAFLRGQWCVREAWIYTCDYSVGKIGESFSYFPVYFRQMDREL